MIDLDLFFRFLKGRCHSNQFWAKLAKWPFSTLAFQNWLEYRNMDEQLYNAKDACACTNCVNFGPVTLHGDWGMRNSYFWDDTEKIGLSYRISHLIFTNVSAMVEACMQIIQESLSLASMARDDPPASSTASSTAATMRGKVGSEFET